MVEWMHSDAAASYRPTELYRNTGQLWITNQVIFFFFFFFVWWFGFCCSEKMMHRGARTLKVKVWLFFSLPINLVNLCFDSLLLFKELNLCCHLLITHNWCRGSILRTRGETVSISWQFHLQGTHTRNTREDSNPDRSRVSISMLRSMFSSLN